MRRTTSRSARLNLAALESRLAPANLFVTNNLDSGPGSFRQAILDANFFSDADTITFSNFFATPQVITLQSELPLVGRPVAIVGTGADKCVIDGNNAHTLLRIAHFNFEPPMVASVSGLTFRNGASASNIAGVALGADTVTLDGVRILNSTGASGGLYVAGTTLTLRDCEISGNTTTSQFGGGLQMWSGAVLAQRCTFSNNGSGTGGGGGIYAVGGTLTMENCTISGNKTASVGGGLVVGPSASATLVHCTLTGNQAGAGGGLRAGGAVTVLSSIISGNTATSTFPDVHTIGTLTMETSALGDKSGATYADKGGNLIGADVKLGPLAANGGFAPTHALLAGSAAIDAGKAGVLPADQRGVARTGPADIGAFESHAPVATLAPIPTVASASQVVSIAITYTDEIGMDLATVGPGDVRVTGPFGFDTVADFQQFTPSADGRGGTAVYTINPPAGGWRGELNGKYAVTIPPGQVTDTHGFNAVIADSASFGVLFARTFVVTNLADSGPGSLRQAVLDSDTAANGLPDTITFAPGLAGTITLTTGELAHTDALTINGPGADKLAISGNGASRIFNHESGPVGYWLILNGLTLRDALAPGDGGAIRMGDEILILNNCAFVNNATATGAGGAIAFVGGQGGTLQVTDCTFINNISDGGGAIFLNAPSAVTTIERSTFDLNVAFSGGGAIYVANGGSLSIAASTLSNNLTGGSDTDGGGIFFSGKVGASGFTIRNSTLSGNSAPGRGGAIALYFAEGAVTVQNSTIVANSAAAKTGGGGFASNVSATSLLLESSILSLNLAPNSPNKDVATPGSVFAKTSAPGTSKAGAATYIDLGGNLAPNADLKLGQLADNGGPTRTHALLSGSPCINAGSNPAAAPTDQRGLARSVGGVDIGAYERQPPTLAVVVNDGAAQRSLVTSITVHFSEPVAFPNGVAAAFSLTRTGPSGALGAVNLNFVQAGQSVVLTFAAGGPVGNAPGGSLIDGTYVLSIDAAKVSGVGGALDGNGDGTAGDNYVSPTSGPGRIFRLFGDQDGDADVDAADYIAFRGAFGGVTNLAFDADGDGDVDSADFVAFRGRFGQSV